MLLLMFYNTVPFKTKKICICYIRLKDYDIVVQYKTTFIFKMCFENVLLVCLLSI